MKRRCGRRRAAAAPAPMPHATPARTCPPARLQITIEELNVLDKLPHYCPVCAYHEVRSGAGGGTGLGEPSVKQTTADTACRLPALPLPPVEPDGAGGDDFRVPQPAAHLHQAQGCVGWWRPAACLQPAAGLRPATALPTAPCQPAAAAANPCWPLGPPSPAPQASCRTGRTQWCSTTGSLWRTFATGGWGGGGWVGGWGGGGEGTALR